METPFLAALVDMTGGSETLVSPMGAPACGFNVAAHAGHHPWFQHNRHTKRAAMTPERTAAKTILVCRSFGIGSPITDVYDVTYYTATLHASSILRSAERNFRPFVQKSRHTANSQTMPSIAQHNKSTKQHRKTAKKGRIRRPLTLANQPRQQCPCYS